MREVIACAIIAREGDAGDLDEILASHPRIYMAEGCFYRDVLRDACEVPVRVVPPSSLDPSGSESWGGAVGEGSEARGDRRLVGAFDGAWRAPRR